MFWQWIKQYMPRGLYGRAALILIFPVVFLQLLVSVVFIQRHFEGVTRQMTASVLVDLAFVTRAADDGPPPNRAQVSAIAADLQLEPAWPDTVPDVGDDTPFVDFTGGGVRRYLRDGLPQISEISLADSRRVTVWIETGQGPLRLSFSRGRVSASNPHQLLVIMVVLGGIMTAIAFLFLRNQLRPMMRLGAAAQAYGRGRIVHYTPGGAQEVRAAGTAFLDMRNRIERQSQSRTLMLSGVSHDLRTPLTRMRLGLSMLDEADAAPLLQDVDDMQRLLDAFLDFARSDAADAADSLEPVVPQDLLADLLADAERASQPVVAGEVTGHRDAVPLRRLAVNRALDNLVGNALRYGSRAVVSLYVTDRAVRFVVEDDGPGIPADRRDEAQRPFVRLDPSRNQDAGTGVGLGLSIVTDIARHHGGMLRLGDSDALGGLKAELVLAR
jgi:two-component system osmolarity sensor histidine kinase EnvZ